MVRRTLTASQEGQEKIHEAIEVKKWKVETNDTRPLLEASLKHIALYQAGNKLSDNDTKWLTDFEKLFYSVGDKKLNQEEKNAKLSKIKTAIIKSSDSNLLENIKKYIGYGEIYVHGISGGTWVKFARKSKREPVNKNAFQLYCYILDLDWREIVERTSTEAKIIELEQQDKIFSSSKDLKSVNSKFSSNSTKLNCEIKFEDYIKNYLNYVRTYKKRYGSIKILTMHKPIPLEELYTEVIFSEKVIQGNIYEFNSQYPGMKIANDYQYLTVIAEPGAGKSIFLRRIGLESLKGSEGKYNYNCIPVFLELKRFDKKNIDFIHFISNEFNICNLVCDESIIQNLLEQGKFLILLDGLDEVSYKNRDEFVREIDEFVIKYPSNRFIVTCRASAYNPRLSQFTDLILANFHDIQIENFISKWFTFQAKNSTIRSENNLSDYYWSMIRKFDNKGVKELAKSPLLLTLLCIIHEFILTTANDHITIYQKSLDIVLTDWLKTKNTEFLSKGDKGIDISNIQAILSHIAYWSFSSDNLFFYSHDIVRQINLLSQNNQNPMRIDELIDLINVRQGIILEHSLGLFCFSHLCFQEYLVAQHIVENKELLHALVANQLVNIKWKYIFLLIAELMRNDVDELLILINNKARDIIKNNEAIRSLLKYVDTITYESKGDFSYATKRACAIYLFLSLISGTIHSINMKRYDDYSEYLDNSPMGIVELAYKASFIHSSHVLIARSLVVSFGFDVSKATDLNFNALQIIIETNIFNNKVDFSELIKNFQMKASNQRLNVNDSSTYPLSLWWKALGVDPNSLIFSDSDMLLLKDYLYANLILVSCKNSTNRFTQKVWQDIEDKMLKYNVIQEHLV